MAASNGATLADLVRGAPRLAPSPSTCARADVSAIPALPPWTAADARDLSLLTAREAVTLTVVVGSTRQSAQRRSAHSAFRLAERSRVLSRVCATSTQCRPGRPTQADGVDRIVQSASRASARSWPATARPTVVNGRSAPAHAIAASTRCVPRADVRMSELRRSRCRAGLARARQVAAVRPSLGPRGSSTQRSAWRDASSSPAAPGIAAGSRNAEPAATATDARSSACRCSSDCRRRVGLADSADVALTVRPRTSLPVSEAGAAPSLPRRARTRACRHRRGARPGYAVYVGSTTSALLSRDDERTLAWPSRWPLLLPAGWV